VLIRLTGAVLLLGLLMTTSCWATDAEPPAGPKHDGRNTYEEFNSTIRSFPYTAPRERRDRIVRGHSTLEIGMTKEQVARVIGEPDYSVLGYGPKAPDMKWKGSSWVYYLSKREDLANSHDPVVRVFFDTENRAVWIVPSNVEGLREKGSTSTPHA